MCSHYFLIMGSLIWWGGFLKLQVQVIKSKLCVFLFLFSQRGKIHIPGCDDTYLTETSIAGDMHVGWVDRDGVAREQNAGSIGTYHLLYDDGHRGQDWYSVLPCIDMMELQLTQKPPITRLTQLSYFEANASSDVRHVDLYDSELIVNRITIRTDLIEDPLHKKDPRYGPLTKHTSTNKIWIWRNGSQKELYLKEHYTKSPRNRLFDWFYFHKNKRQNGLEKGT